MAEIFVERRGDDYVALLNGRTIARGRTQAEAEARARRKYPEAAIKLERVRKTKAGKPDKWRT